MPASFAEQICGQDVFIDKAKDTGTGKSMFVKQAELGSFKENVACYANVSDIYKIVLSNLSPTYGPMVELKAERIMTNIGDFAMPYHSNAKLFHFVPSYNNVPTDLFEGKLELVLELGHTVDIGKFQTLLTGDTDFIGKKGPIRLPWTREPNRILGNVLLRSRWERIFAHLYPKRANKWPVELPGVPGDVVIGENMEGLTEPVERTNVFYGGVKTKETEYEVSRVLDSVIHNAAKRVQGKIV